MNRSHREQTMDEHVDRTEWLSDTDLLIQGLGENNAYVRESILDEWRVTPRNHFQRLSYQALDRMITQLSSNMSFDNSFQYPAETNVADPQGDCSICLDTIQNPIIRLECSHQYHASCIRNWKQNSCPYCRLPIDKNLPGQQIIDLPID